MLHFTAATLQALLPHNSSALAGTSLVSAGMRRALTQPVRTAAPKHHPLVMSCLELAVKTRGSHVGRGGRGEHNSLVACGTQLNTQQKAVLWVTPLLEGIYMSDVGSFHEQILCMAFNMYVYPNAEWPTALPSLLLPSHYWNTNPSTENTSNSGAKESY